MEITHREAEFFFEYFNTDFIHYTWRDGCWRRCERYAITYSFNNKFSFIPKNEKENESMVGLIDHGELVGWLSIKLAIKIVNSIGMAKRDNLRRCWEEACIEY